MDAERQLPFIEKAGYAAGDAAASFVFMTMILFQTNFYTDVLGVTASEAATVILVARLWDAAADPIVGMLTDRTNTRWGKFRPWILCTAVPWCLAMVLAYTTPAGWSRQALFAYAIVTNMLLMSLYSMNNIPYAALGGVMTGNVDERSKLNSVRFIAVNMAQFVVGGLTLPLVAKFSAGSGPQHGWKVTITLWAVVCLVLFLITFATTRERVRLPSRQKADLVSDLRALIRNHPWRVMFLVTLFHFCLLSFRGAALYNYYHHYADRKAMYEWAQAVGLTTPAGTQGVLASIRMTLGYVVSAGGVSLAHSNVADVFNSVVNLLNTVVTILVLLLSSGLSRRFGKKAVAISGFGLAAVGTTGFYLLGPTQVDGMIVLTIVIAACYAPTIPLIWAIYADVADYSEWQAGRRCTGIVFATIGFALKCGLALGSSCFLWVMVLFFQYDARSPDTAQAMEGFRACSGLMVGLLFLVCTLLLIAYELDKRTTMKMASELTALREPGLEAWAEVGGKSFAGQYRQ